MFELAADHHRGVRRFNLRPPQGKGKARREAVLEFVKEWAGVLWVEKCRQFEALPHGGELPPLPDAWGQVDAPRKMPCVVWVFVPQAGK